MSGPIRPPLKVQEVDGTPSVIPVNVIKVTDGTLTDNGGATVTIATGGGGGGSMTSFDVAGNTGPSQTVSDGETLTIQGGSSGADIKVTMSANDTATLDLQATGVSAGTYTNATLTVDANGRLTSASSGTAPVTGSGTSAQVTFWNGTTTVTGSTNLTFDGTNLSVGGYVKSGTGVYDTNGSTDLKLQTNSGTNAGTLTLKEETNGNLVFTPTGTGVLQLDGVSGGNDGAVKLMCSEGSHGIKIESPAHSAGANYTFKMPTSMGTDGQVLTTDGSSQTSWTTVSAGGTPGGSDSQVQYNNGGSFGGIASMTFDDTAGAEQILISDSSTSPLVKIVQTGAGNAFEVHDQATDTSIFHISNAGKVAIGTNFFGADPLYVSGSMFCDRYKVGGQSAGLPAFSYSSQTSGMFFATDMLGLSVVGSEKIRITTNGEIGIGGANYGTSGQVLTSGGSGSAVSWTTPSSGGGSNTDSFGFKMESSGSNPRVPMANALAGSMTNSGMNSYYAYGTLFTVLEDKTLDKAWIYINTLMASAPSGVKIGIYELPTNTLDQTSLTGTLIATATFATSKFDSSTGSTGYSSESWAGASGQSLTLDKTKYYACMVSSWSNDQQSGTSYNILAWSASNLPNIAGSQGNVGVSSGFQAWVNGTTDPSATLSLNSAGGQVMPAVWSQFS